MKKNYFFSQKRVFYIMVCIFGLLLQSNLNAQDISQFSTLNLTGFNHDVIAEGSGTNADNKVTGGIDGEGQVFYAKNFVPSTPYNTTPAQASAAAYGAGLPNDGILQSAATPGLSYQLSHYGINNALILRDGAGNDQSGTLTVAQPKKAEKVYVAWVRSGSAARKVTITVNFTDNSSEIFSDIESTPDWYDTNPAATVISGIGRIRSTNNEFSGRDEVKLFQHELTLSVANRQKQISSIQFTKVSGNVTIGIFAVSVLEPGPAVTSIDVTTQGGVPAEITTKGGTLQLNATLLPAGSNQNVTWSVIEQLGGWATVSNTGLVTAIKNGNVTVRAISSSDPSFYKDIVIAITNQSATAECQFTPLAVTGLNADIIAEGTGADSGTKTTQRADTANNVLYAADFTPLNPFNASAAQQNAAAYGGGLSASGVFHSGLTPGLAYQMPSYNGNNVLFLKTSVTNNATLTVNEPKKAEKLYVAWTNTNGTLTSGNSTVGMVITFDDGSTQDVGTTSVPNWLSGSYNSSITNNRFGLVNANNNQFNSINGPRIHEKVVNINLENHHKKVASITFNKTTTTANYTVIVFGVSICETTALEPASVVVTTQNDVPAEITTKDGTLQLVANVLPEGSAQQVNWSVVEGKGGWATVDNTGLVTGIIDGKVTVRATSIYSSAIYGDIEITVSNQEVAGICKFTPLSVTGFNHDVIAEGDGDASTKTTTNLDDSKAFYAQNFKPLNPHTSAESAAIYGSGLPNDGYFHSVATPGLAYQLADYNGNNALVLKTSITNVGTLTLTEQKKAEKVYVAWLRTNATNNVGITVNFADETSQTFAGTAPIDWASSNTNDLNQAAIRSLGSVITATNEFADRNGRNIFQRELQLNPENHHKLISSITFNKTSGTAAATTVIFGVSICETTAEPITSFEIATANDVAPVIKTKGGTLQLVAKVEPANANPTANWSVNLDESTGNATINSDGLVTAISAGTVKINASAYADSSLTDSIEITITNQAGPGECDFKPLTFTPESFNADVFAEGTGGEATTKTNATLDGIQALYSNDFVPTTPYNANANQASAAAFGGGLSANGVIRSGATAGLSYHIDYTKNNALIINNTLGNTSTLTLAEANQKKAQNVYVAWTSTNQAQNVGITVNFADGTNQVFNAASVTDWGTSTTTNLVTTVGIIRVSNNDFTALNGRRIFQRVLSIDAGNQQKLISSITFNRTSTSPSGTTIIFGVSICETAPEAPTSIDVVTKDNVSSEITTDGGTLELIAEVNPSNTVNQGVTWSITEGAEYANIDPATGEITAIGNGTVKVRATSTADGTVFGETEVTVNIYPTEIEVTIKDDASSTITTIGGTLELVATVTPTNANADVVWSITEGEEFGSVDAETGIVTAITNGTIIVRATSVADETVYSEIEITVNLLPNTIVVTTQDDVDAIITTEGGTLQLVATVTPEEATNQDVTWSVVEGGTGDATVDEDGLVTAVRDGVVTVRATSVADETVYGEIEITISGNLSVGDFDASNLKIYPNPTSDLITISSTEEVKKVSIFNMIGQQVLISDAKEMNVSKLQQGTYLIKIEFENGKTYSEKIIKK